MILEKLDINLSSTEGSGSRIAAMVSILTFFICWVDTGYGAFSIRIPEDALHNIFAHANV